MIDKSKLLTQTKLERGPALPKIEPLQPRMYNMYEVASIVAKAVNEAETRVMYDLTARFLDGSCYALVKQWDKLQDPETRLLVYRAICQCVNHLEETPKGLHEARAELWRQTGIDIQDGELHDKVRE